MSVSVQQAAHALRSGQITSRQLTNQALADIAALDGDLESFVLVDRSGSLAAAAAINAWPKEKKTGEDPQNSNCGITPV